MAIFLAILAFGSIPGARQEIGLLASGVILHSVAYSVLTLLLFAGSAGSRTGRAVTAVATVMAMGALDELLQSALPYRVGSVSDWLVDITASAVAGSLLWAFFPPPVTQTAS
jgi:VanZ family protein